MIPAAENVMLSIAHASRANKLLQFDDSDSHFYYNILDVYLLFSTKI